MPFQRESELPIFYKGERLRNTYRADFICFGTIVIEVKALSRLGRPEESQIINYLKATELEKGLLLNFGASSLEYRRFVFSKSNKSVQSADQ